MSQQPPRESDLYKRVKAAIIADLSTNREPDPLRIPCVAVAYDPTTSVFRIAHAGRFDVEVHIVYLRACELKAQVAKVLALEAEVEAQLSPEVGRALAGLEPFDDKPRLLA